MKAPRQITRILSVAAFAVWGSVAYELYTTTEGNNSGPIGDMKARDTTTSNPYIYKTDIRDPFQSVAVRGISRRTQPETTAWAPPPLKLTGLLYGDGGRTAILEGEKGEIHFLGEGDTIAGMRILKIYKSSLLHEYHKQKREWTLDNK